MDIGSKIKAARLNANLTQEQVAEALQVSRQTISNWETEKTYPDIVRVVQMSDLYGVSLDHLLKGEPSVPNYLRYLEESTDIVNSKNKLSQLIVLAVYLGIWASSLLVFWFFTSGSAAMGYAFMFLWVLLPVTTFLTSLLIGKNNYWGNWKWIFPVFFGLMYMLAEYATFSAANMAAFHKMNLPQFDMLPIGALISMIGLGIGVGVTHLKELHK